MKLSIKDAAVLLGKSERTVRLWAQEGKLPGAHRDGGRWVVDRDKLLAELPPGAADMRADEVRRVRERLDAALDRATPTPAASSRRFYSVRDMHTFQLGIGAIASLRALGRDVLEYVAKAQQWLAEHRRLEVRPVRGGVCSTRHSFRYLGMVIGRAERRVAPRTIRRLRAKLVQATQDGWGEPERARRVENLANALRSLAF